MPHPLRRGALACLSALICATALAGDVVRVGGSGAGLGGLQVLAQAYGQRHPDRQVVVLPSIGSSGGIRAVLDGKLDLSCSARPLVPEERAKQLIDIPWATTAFVFATQAGHPVESLSLAGIEDIYAGRRTQWKDGRPIRFILRPKSDSAHAFLSDLSPTLGPAVERSHALPGVCVAITDQEALVQLERTPGSFGTTVLGLIVSEGRKVATFPLAGVRPTDPAYPLLLPLVLVHRKEGVSPATLEFLQFLRSKEGMRLLANSGYRPASVAGMGR